MTLATRILLLVSVVLSAMLGCFSKAPQGANQPRTGVAKSEEKEGAKLPPTEKARDNSYESPEAVYAAHASAVKRGDWATAFDCLTESAQDQQILGFFFLATTEDSDVMDRHIDEAEFQKLTNDKKEPSEQQVANAVLTGIKNKRACYLDAAQKFAEQLQEKAPQEKLRNVKISGDRASGVTTTYSEMIELGPGEKENVVRTPHDQEIRFSKDKNGWRIDAEPLVYQNRSNSSP